ncbi:MAG: hypothetical protein IKD88_04520 [Lachnospiraceae bacterium]|nr:hypothetical protein [Lachnospiraceae bacterium]
MANAIRDHLEFLRQAKAELAEVNATAAAVKELDLSVMNLERDLENEKRAQSDLLETTIKNRRAELNATYDAEISKARDLIQKENVRRSKAIAAGKKARSKVETRSYALDNRELKKQMREMFRTDGMPAIANTTFFYGLYGPGSPAEALIFIAALAVCFVLVPFLLYHFLPWTGPAFLAIIYVICIVVFVGIYLLIMNATKGKHREAFLKGKQIRKQIRKNNLEAARIERGIQKDKDESHYDLEEFDANLEKMRSDLDEIMARRSEALQNFEEVTKQVITDEITDNGREKLQDLEVRLESAKYRRTEAQDEARDASLGFTDVYGPYIDRAFWNEADLDALTALVENGEARSVIDAQTILRASKGK